MLRKRFREKKKDWIAEEDELRKPKNFGLPLVSELPKEDIDKAR
jgi:hypothetical protein